MPKTSYKVFSTNFDKLNRVQKRQLVFFFHNTSQKTPHEISKVLGLSVSGVRKILKRWKGQTSFQDKPRKGRPNILTPHSQKKLDSIIEQSSNSSSQSILNTLAAKNHLKKHPTSRTIRNYRKKLGFQKKKTRKKAILRKENKIKRLNYAMKYKNYKWRNQIFIDETDIELYHDAPTGYYKKNQIPVIHNPRKSPKIKLICGISRKGPIFLRCYHSTLDAKKFVRIMVDLKKHIYSKYNDPTIVLDNATPHTAHYTKRMLQRHYKLLYIPPQSPELNPIEKAFEFFKKRVINSDPKNVKMLISVTKKNWKKISKDECNRTILQLQNECQVIINNKGGNHY